MYEWYNLTVKYRGDWGTLGLHIETGLFDRNYIAICSPAGQSMVPKLTNFHFPPCLSLGPFFIWKYEKWWSISVCIDHGLLDFPMILVVSYTCTITLSLMYNGFASNTPHTKTMNNIRYEVSLNVPQNCLKVPRVSEGAPKVFQGAPTFFRHILLLQRLALDNCRL